LGSSVVIKLLNAKRKLPRRHGCAAMAVKVKNCHMEGIKDETEIGGGSSEQTHKRGESTSVNNAKNSSGVQEAVRRSGGTDNVGSEQIRRKE